MVPQYTAIIITMVAMVWHKVATCSIKMYMYWQFAEYTYIVLYYFTYSMLLDKYSSIMFSWSGAFC